MQKMPWKVGKPRHPFTPTSRWISHVPIEQSLVLALKTLHRGHVVQLEMVNNIPVAETKKPDGDSDGINPNNFYISLLLFIHVWIWYYGEKYAINLSFCQTDV